MKKLLTLFTLLLTVCSGVWAEDPVTILDFSTGTPSDVFTISNSDGGTAGNVTNAFMTAEDASTFTGKTWTSPNGRKIQVTKISSSSAYYSILTTKSSYTDVKRVAFQIISTDKGSKFTVQISSKADFSSDVTTIQAETTLENAGVSGNNKWLEFSKDLATQKSGYIRIKIQAPSSGKFIGFTDFAITEAAPASVTNPSFSVAAGSSIVKNTASAVTLTSAGNTIYYKWNASDNAYPTVAALVADADGNGDSPVAVTTPSTTGTWYLYAVAKDGNDYSDVVKRSYTITNPSYTVTLNTNGGTINAGNVTEYVEGTGATLPTNVTKDCYTFAGWYANSELTGDEVTTISTDATGNKEYWAKWTPLYTTGTYTFENNKTVGTETSKTVTTTATAYGAFRVDNMFFSDMTIQYEEGTYSGVGDDFKGWKIKTSGASIKLLVENDADVTFGVGNLTSGAKVSYTKQDGTLSNNNALVAKTDNVYSVKGGTIVTFVTDGASTVTLKKIEVVAPAAKFDVTYNANGSGEEDVVRNVSKVDENMFTYAGHSFTGWNTQADGNGTDYAVGAAVTSTLTLFAQWISTYTVEFNLQGHGSAIDAQEVAEGSKVTEPTAPTADGWVFGGWYEESTCENEFDFNTTINADKTLYAKWTEDVKVSAFSLSFVNTSDYKMSDGDNKNLTASEVSVTGGSASIRFWNSGKTNITVLETSKNIYYSTGNMNLKLVLNTPLKVGDVISFAGGDGNQIAITDTDESPNSSSNKEVTESYSYTVKADDHLVGKSTIYVGREGGSSTRHGAITITSAAANVTVSNLGIEGEKDYATMYYGTVAMAVPAGVKAKTYKVVDGKLTVSRTYENGSEYDVIPAGEAVVLEADVDANTPYMFSVSSTTTEPDGDNLLRGTDAAQTIDAAGYKYYKLAKNNAGTKVGFYYAVDGGTSITNGAHKAYLAVPTGSGEAKEYFVLGGEDETSSEATAISAVEIEIANGATLYNLAGQKVGKDYKGIIVVNGKKYVRK